MRRIHFMSYSFSRQHGTMLLKYAGISFISGAVNHGFFSGERSLWTAAIGMLLFVLGAWLEHRAIQANANAGVNTGVNALTTPGLLVTLFWGSLLSIGLGFFTGGLQHFPDSPARSAWVVPLGFAVSVLALWVSSGAAWQRSATVYTVVAGLCVGVASWGAYQWLQAHPQGGGGGEHSHAADTAPTSFVAQTVTRSITIHMDDTMRFKPENVEVRAGEVIRFVVHNGGQVQHEWVLGSEAEIAAHAVQMREAAGQSGDHAHQHGTGAAISVAPGEMGEIVVGFHQEMTLQMACLIPGHYEAGMRGTLTVLAATSANTSKPSSSANPNHQHH
jgi:uncharacterized cupredoxin-like copper-binding protein